MATDKTQPPVKTILLIGGISIAAIIGSELLFQSYFNSVYSDEEHAKIYGRPSELLIHTVARDEARLREGHPIPIDQAMETIGRGERPEVVAPRPSSDFSAMLGWLQMVHQFTPPDPSTDASPDTSATPDTTGTAPAVPVPSAPAAVVPHV